MSERDKKIGQVIFACPRNDEIIASCYIAREKKKEAYVILSVLHTIVTS